MLTKTLGIPLFIDFIVLTLSLEALHNRDAIPFLSLTASFGFITTLIFLKLKKVDVTIRKHQLEFEITGL